MKKIENSQEIIAYIENLEKDLQEEQEMSDKLFETNRMLIAEREEIIKNLTNKTSALINFYNLTKKNENTDADTVELRALKHKINACKDILKVYFKNNL